MTAERDDNADAEAYELFVRRVFNCDRGDSRFPFADGNAWVNLISKWNFATDPTRSKNSLGQREKDFERYFKLMAEYFDKTIDYALKKHAYKEGREKMQDGFTRLKADTEKAKSIDDLRAILTKALAMLDEFNIVLR